MSEEEAKSVNQEVANPEANSEEQVKHTHEEAQPAEGSKEFNFARLREKAEASDKKSAELEKQVKELRDAFEGKNKPAPPPEEDELSNLDPEDIITVKQAMKVSERQAKKIVQEMLQKQEVVSMPSKAKAQFDDFDSIMTEENIKKLENEEPEIAIFCAKAPNPWETTYKMVKKFVMPKEASQSKGEKKMEENMAKPASSNSVGAKTPLQSAYMYSEADKDQLHKEMKGYARNAL